MTRWRSLAAWGWAVSLIVVWFAVSRSLGQSPFAAQVSPELVAFGAFRGGTLSLAGLAVGAIAGAALRWHRSSPAAARALHRET